MPSWRITHGPSSVCQSSTLAVHRPVCAQSAASRSGLARRPERPALERDHPLQRADDQRGARAHVAGRDHRRDRRKSRAWNRYQRPSASRNGCGSIANGTCRRGRQRDDVDVRTEWRLAAGHPQLVSHGRRVRRSSRATSVRRTARPPAPRSCRRSPASGRTSAWPLGVHSTRSVERSSGKTVGPAALRTDPPASAGPVPIAK